MWKAVNSAALVGWTAVTARLLVLLLTGGRSVGSQTWTLALALEVLCCLEVVRIMTGSLQGNLFLGVSIHYIRMFVCLCVLPRIDGHPAVPFVLLAWAVTEVCRYPYYIFGGARASKLRYATPLLTFPLGAGGEAWACYSAMPHLAGIPHALAALQIVVNILGGMAVYPGMVKKAQKALKGGEAAGRPRKEEASAVLFPLDPKGGRSTTAAGRSLVAAALRAGGGDAAARAADRCERERDWRFGYDRHLLRLVELGCASPEVALRQARAGLAWAHEHFQFVAAPGAEPQPLAALAAGGPAEAPAGVGRLATLRVEGPEVSARAPGAGLRVPFNGAYARGSTAPPGPDAALQGRALKEQLDSWASRGVLEPDAALRAAAAADHLAGGGSLAGCHFVVLGASSAMGPTRHLLEHGAHVIGVSRGGGTASRRAWRELAVLAGASPGAVLEAPLAGGEDRVIRAGADPAAAEEAGADLLAQPLEIRDWLLEVLARVPPGERVVVGNYSYLDGDLHVKLTLAADALIAALQAARPKVGVAFLGTPTDAHVVPAAAAQAAREAFGSWGRAAAPLEALARLLTLGRRLTPNARPPVAAADGQALHVLDGFSLAQGPNYAIAKRLQHWRAIVTYSEGGLASSRVAPSTATASVVHNRTFGWAYLGMPFFAPLEVFKEETASALMAALLVADVVKCGDGHSTKDPDAPQAALRHPMALSGTEAVHGGVFRCPYKLGTLGEVCVLVHFLGGPEVCKVLSAGLPVAGAALLALALTQF